MNNYSEQFSTLLEEIAKELDIPESYFEQAVDRYESIGEWLERDGSKVALYSPEIFPQGSFRLGTVTRPISEKDEYDLDLVSELNLDKSTITQQMLKDLVGQEIKSYAHDKGIKSPVEEGRRCWTLDYADVVQFHIDILPAIPNAEMFKQLLEEKGYIPPNWSEFAIAITDNTHHNYDQIDFEWPRSNPKGYAEWFRNRMRTQFDIIRKAYLMESQVEDVPDYKIKTPLQQSIQICKRHRDIWFEEKKFRYHAKAKPISIILTTLAARAYNNEADLQEALWNIVSNMHKHIDRDINGVACILNPVDPLENFADKWKEDSIRETCFMDWLEQLQEDLRKAFELGDIQIAGKSLKSCLGENIVDKALRNFPDQGNRPVSTLAATVIPRKPYAR